MLLSTGRFFGGAGSGSGGGGGDPSWSDVVLLLGFNNPNLATATSDESSFAHTLTYGGTARIETAQFKFGTASHRCGTSTSGRLLVSYAATLNLGVLAADPFTVELFLRTTNPTGNHYLIRQQGASTTDAAWNMTAHNNNLQFTKRTTAGGASSCSSAVTLVSGTWHHIAISKNAAGKYRLRFDGAMVANMTPADAAINASVLDYTIGAVAGSNLANTGDHIDEIRVTKGFDRYDTDSAITVPTAEFPRS